MATTLLPSQLTPFTTQLSLSKPKPNPRPTIYCGPRDNRGPLVKGRVLSTEAIQAVQALKRAQRTTGTTVHETLNKTLTRLIKADLIATLRELLRQGHCDLALTVFSTVRSEPWYKTDLSLYADLVLALDKKGGIEEDIDRLIEGLEMEIDGGKGGIDWEDKRGLSRLVKALIGAKRRESMVRIYGVMKKSGWGCSGSGVEVDEYLAKVLSKGLKRFGEESLGREVEVGLEVYLDACLGRVGV
ncbi:uncharacterized protein LOC110703403 [Chenopodium quinoa]|uniref:Uncharacterized protein n=1 Tax=Chenopodium quinoa TaxID=63459 RepID=A0A803LNI3_CHEQI|nr:uncharacterized protein LOC110703403 [Chenopodium quinoa]